MRVHLRMNLIFSSFLRSASDTVSEAALDHPEGGLGMISHAVHLLVAIRPMSREVHHPLIFRLGTVTINRVLFDTMHGSGSMFLRHLKILLPVVCGVGETPPRNDILRKVVPDSFEQLAIVDIRFRHGVAQYDEMIDLYRRMQFDPILIRPDRIWSLLPASFSAAVSGGICSYDRLSLWEQIKNELMKSLPDDGPASASVLPAEHSVMRHLIESEVIHEAIHYCLGLTECRVEQLTEEEPDHQVSLLGRRSAGPTPMLPKGEGIHEVSDALHA